MGLILDSSVLVTAERQGQNARQMLASVAHIVLETSERQPESLFLESRATAFQRHHLRR